MFDDETEPRTKRPKLRPLDKMSVDELEEYIAEMKEEIARVEDHVQKKKAYKDAASSFFKT